MINKEKSGVIYGFEGVTTTEASEECNAIKNQDYRCAYSRDYVLIIVYSEFGFAKAGVGVNALVKKDFPNLDKLRFKGCLGDKNQSYVKAKVIPGQFGEVVEISIN